MLNIIDNHEQNRFEYHKDEKIAFMEYVLENNKITITHTEVPSELGGQGIGSGLVKAVMANIKERKLEMETKCTFVGTYLKRHPELR